MTPLAIVRRPLMPAGAPHFDRLGLYQAAATRPYRPPPVREPRKPAGFAAFTPARMLPMLGSGRRARTAGIVGE